MIKIGKRLNSDNLEEFIFSENLTQDYEDITSVGNFIKIGNFLFKDYKWIRKRLQEFDWNSLTEQEKLSVCQFKGSSIGNCKLILGESYNYWLTNFDIESQNCRRRRFSHAKTLIIKNVDGVGQYQILASLGNLGIQYIDFGVEGTSEGDPINGLFNFIEATGAYAANGVLSMSLTMVGTITKEEMIIQIMDCLRNGNY